MRTTAETRTPTRTMACRALSAALTGAVRVPVRGRRVRAARIEASRRDAIAEIINAYTPPEDRASYIGGPGHELATRLIQGDEQATEEFRALCQKHDLPGDYELHLSYHRASKDMETFDRTVAHHTNMRMRALDVLHKGRKSLAARAEVMIVHCLNKSII